jgi:hypothetical protein
MVQTTAQRYKEANGLQVLKKVVEHPANFIAADAVKQRMLKDQAQKKWIFHLLMNGSDQAKYGSLIKGFISQFYLGNDQYPKTLQTAHEVLSNHKIDQRFYNT